MKKVLEGKMYIIERRDEVHHKDAPLAKLFKVVGSKGDLYNVIISLHPTCNCASAQLTGVKVCKHILCKCNHPGGDTGIKY